MSAIAELRDIDYSYDKTGQVLCRNQKGLIFFLQAEPPAPKPEAARPTPQAPTWQPMAAVEVEMHRSSEPMAISEATRRPESAPEAPVAKAAPAKTGPLPEAPEPGKPAEKGWFGKLFK